MRAATTGAGQGQRAGDDPGGRVSDRIRLVDAAIDLVEEHGGRALLPEALADRFDDGICAEQVVREFPTRDGLVAATLVRWHDVHVRPAVAVAAEFGTVAFVHALLVASRGAPQVVRLLIATLATTSDPDHPLSDFYRQQSALLRATIRGFLVDDVAAGREPPTMDPSPAADQLLSVYHGLQLQSVLQDDFDVVGAFDRAATRFRHGWAEEYHREPLFSAGD